jgi:hypothetical protein
VKFVQEIRKSKNGVNDRYFPLRLSIACVTESSYR